MIPGSPASVSAGALPAPKRSMVIDVVRGLAISLVVFGHTNQGIGHRNWWGTSHFGADFDTFIYSFHMPAFFFVSGIFLCSSIAKRGWRKFAYNKLETMIYPYVVWSVIIVLGIYLFGKEMVQRLPTPGQYFVNLVTGNYSWFLPTLFVAVMLGMLLRRVPMPVLFAGSVLVALVWHPLGVGDIDNALHHLPFLVAGMWVGTRFQAIERMPRWIGAVLAVVLGVVIAALVPLRPPDSRSLYLPAGLIGILMLLSLARALDRGWFARGLAWAGEASFGIFLISAYPQGGGRELLRLLHCTAPVPQLIVPSLLAICIPAWLYQHRVKLHIGWLFVWPFSGAGTPGTLATAPARRLDENAS